MKNKLLLFIALLTAVCMLSGCAYLPILLGAGSNGSSSSLNGFESSVYSTPVESGDTVTISRAEYERYQKFANLFAAMDTIEQNYYKPVDETALIDGAVQGMLKSMDDPYTFYYTPDEFAKMWEDDAGEYAGVGMQITTNYTTNICTISRVFKGSPAEQAGVKKGDILYKVDHDLIVNAETINDAVDIMRGVPGTPVDVTFIRDGEEITFTMIRANVVINQVESMKLNDDIGLIKLYEFSSSSSAEFAQTAQAMADEGVKGIIIDLRDNPGGWVGEAQSIADLFMDAGVLCTIQYGDGTTDNYSYRTRDGKLDVKLVVLINENSASSSEILSGALRDRAGAKLVGVKSYGKGIMQSVEPLNGGAGMQYTIAQYFTPNGTAVHTIGLEPDVESKLPEGDNGDYDIGDEKDPQLQTAIEVMNDMLK